MSDWGKDYKNEQRTTQPVRATGTYTTWNGFNVPYSEYSVAEEGRSRGGKSSNPVVDGWRQPSTYHRSSARAFAQSGSIIARNSNNGKSQWVASGSAYSAKPSFPHSANGTFSAMKPKGFDLNGHFLQGLSLNERNRMDSECLAKLKSGKVNYGLFLMEARRSANETARLFRDVLLMYRKFRRGQLPNLSEKALAQQYLRYIYGVKPLASDLYASFTQTQLKIKKDLLIVAKASISNSDAGKHTFHGAQSSWSHAYRGTTKIYASVNSPALVAAANLGFTNPLEIAWEIVPYSFVLDWIMPVGTFLSNLDATNGLSWKGGTRSCTAVGKSIGTSQLVGFAFDPSWTSVGGSFPFAGWSCNSYVRERLGGFPRPVPYIKSPFSTTHVTNALALWRNTRR